MRSRVKEAAAKILHDPKASKESKSVAASALTQVSRAERVVKRLATDRFEVIDETGRAYVRRGIKATLSYQDDGRTLKVFIDKRTPE